MSAAEVYNNNCYKCGEQGHFIKHCDVYKTQICKHFQGKSSCKFGAECYFAHGAPDLRLLHHKCQVFHKKTTKCPEKKAEKKTEPVPVFCKNCETKDHLTKDCPERYCTFCDNDTHWSFMCRRCRNCYDISHRSNQCPYMSTTYKKK